MPILPSNLMLLSLVTLPSSAHFPRQLLLPGNLHLFPGADDLSTHLAQKGLLDPGNRRILPHNQCMKLALSGSKDDEEHKISLFFLRTYIKSSVWRLRRKIRLS